MVASFLNDSPPLACNFYLKILFFYKAIVFTIQQKTAIHRGLTSAAYQMLMVGLAAKG